MYTVITEGNKVRQYHGIKYLHEVRKTENDYVIVNDHPISEKQLEKYASEGAEQIGVHGSISPDGRKMVWTTNRSDAKKAFMQNLRLHVMDVSSLGLGPK